MAAYLPSDVYVGFQVVLVDRVSGWQTAAPMLTGRERKLPLVPQLGWKKAFYAAGVLASFLGLGLSKLCLVLQ